MSATVSNMLPVVPKFASASATSNGGYDGSHLEDKNNNNARNMQSQSNWGSALNALQTQMDAGGDQDFDLLAEYLLDDGAMTLPNFSSSGFYEASSELLSPGPVVAPQQTQQFQQQPVVNPPSLFADPLADAAAASTLMAQQQPANATVPNAAEVQSQVQQVIAAAQADASHQVMPSMPSGTFPQVTYTPSTATTSSTMPSPQMIVHQHAQPPQSVTPTLLVGTKRPAVDASKFSLTQQQQPRGGPRQKSQAQIDRRRERNRILARRTRLRKKFFFESLQKEVMDLQRENNVLKEIVKSKLDPTLSKTVLQECKVGDLPSIVAENCGESENLDEQDYAYVCSIKKSQQCFVITDPSLNDNPIVYASEDFFQLTGYSRDEVLGRNCRFLQGKDTSPAKVEKVRKAVASGEDVNVCFINYTAEGKAFWNQLFIAALRDTQNNVVNFIGVTVKVASPPPDDPEAGRTLIDIPQKSNEVDDLLGAASAAVSAAPTVAMESGAGAASVAPS